MKFTTWQKTVLTLVLALVLSSTVFAAEPRRDLSDSKSVVEWPVTMTSYGGKLILSDSPEMVSSDGIMYEDTVDGKTRLFFHHVNDTKEVKKILVLLVNDGQEDVNVTLLKYGVAGPGYDWVAVGKQAQVNYLKSTEDIDILTVPAKGAVLLDNKLADKLVNPNMLVNGIYDFKADKPVTVKVIMMPVNAEPTIFYKSAKILPKDSQRLRGTFEGKDRLLIPHNVYNEKDSKVVAITLADNEIDKYVTGIDKTDGSAVINYGNYGVIYNIYIPSTSGGNLSSFLNPRGGEYAGALSIRYRHKYLETQLTPKEKLSFGINTVTDTEFLGSYEGGQSLWFTFTPPGASNLPVKLLLTPNYLNW